MEPQNGDSQAEGNDRKRASNNRRHWRKRKRDSGEPPGTRSHTHTVGFGAGRCVPFGSASTTVRHRLRKPGAMGDRTGTTEPATNGDAGSVTLVGTAHVSEESATRVRETIQTERPEIVAVELDENRYQQLRGETPDDIEPAELLQVNTVFQFLAYWMLSYVQARLGSRFGVEPGADMRAAIETADATGTRVALVDRDIQTTIRRFWGRLTALEKLKLVGGLGVGAADPRLIGVALGVSVGAVLGLIGGVVVAPLLGVSMPVGPSVAAAVGGLAIGGFLGVFLTVGLFPGGSVGVRAAAGTLTGATVGAVLSVTGVSLPVVGAVAFESLGETVVRGGSGVLIGGISGAIVGVGLSLLFAVQTEPAATDPEEFSIEELTDTDVITAMMEEFRRFSPGGAEALIDERDAFIAHRLVALREAGYDVVAVVGAGHRAGIERYLAAPETLPPMETLTGTSSGGRFSVLKLLSYGVLLAFVGFFVLLAMAGVQQPLLLQVFLAWFLFNGLFAFTGARLAGASLLGATVGGSVAWLTSINPLLAPGWFAGYIELRKRPVNIADISRLNELLNDQTRSLRELLADMAEVPLFRLMAIVALTNFGSIVATVLFPFLVLPFFFEGIGTVDEIGALLIEGARESAALIRDLLVP